MKAQLDFIIKGYTTIRKDWKEGNGGGCATFIKQGMQYRQVPVEEDLEAVSVDVWEGDFKCRF